MNSFCLRYQGKEDNAIRGDAGDAKSLKKIGGQSRLTVKQFALK